MSNHKRPYRYLTEEQLRKYLRGELKGEEAHEVERLMLDSPLEAEAMEGWEAFDEADLDQDLALLRGRLDAKRNTSRFPWLRIAASIAVLFTLGISIWLITGQPSEKEYLAEKSTIEKSEEVPELAPAPKEEVNEEEIRLEKADSKGEIIVNEEKSVVKQPVIAEKREDNKTVEIEMTNDNKLAEVIYEEVEETEMVADLLIEPEEVEQVEVDIEVVPEVPIDIPVRTAKVTAKTSAEKGAGFADSQITEAIPSATGAVSRSIGAQPRKIVGIVLDEIDEVGIPGVNVIVTGTTNGTTTDLEGRFSIEVDPSDEELQFSFIGMQDIALPIQDSVVAMMPVDVMSLSEVVVTGYSEASKASITDVDPPYEYESAYPTEGRGNYKDYIEQNLQYPAEALSNAIAGTVRLKATILSNGVVGEIVVIKGIGNGCDEEAIRLVREGPEWTPAVKNGEQITSEVSIKIRFKLP